MGSRAAEQEQRVRQVIALRRALESLPERSDAWRRVQRVERELRQALGVGVPKSAAARVLGISGTALDGWIGRGKLVEVHRPGSSRGEVESWSLVVVAGEVERLREEGAGRNAVAGAVRRLEAEGRLPQRLRPNEHPLILRRDFLHSTPEQRLRQLDGLMLSLGTLAAAAARGRLRKAG